MPNTRPAPSPSSFSCAELHLFSLLISPYSPSLLTLLPSRPPYFSPFSPASPLHVLQTLLFAKHSPDVWQTAVKFRRENNGDYQPDFSSLIFHSAAGLALASCLPPKVRQVLRVLRDFRILHLRFHVLDPHTCTLHPKMRQTYRVLLVGL